MQGAAKSTEDGEALAKLTLGIKGNKEMKKEED